MTSEAPVLREHGNAYNIFILVLTLFSLVIMVLLIVPWLDQDTQDLLMVYDNAIAFIFLADFIYNFTGSKPKREYFIRQRGWLDLLGSIPSLGLTQYGGLLRLARLSRLARIARLLGAKERRGVVEDVLQNRSQYAVFITILSAGMVLSVASILILQFESKSPDANIHTGGDALWWGLVTITTVGYGDRFPVTALGRITGVAVMFAGVGIIGALASILASILVPPPKDDAPTVPDRAGSGPAGGGATPAVSDDVAAQLAALRDEIAGLRAEIAANRSGGAPGSARGDTG
jgi:voltage-gated potassium channel